MSNAIQRIASDMYYQWQIANAAEGVRWLRLLINAGDETMLDAFYHYMLGVDIEGEDMVFVVQVPFESLDSFSQNVLMFVEEQIAMWNGVSKLQDMPSESIDWVADYSLVSEGNPAQLLISNLNNLTQSIVREDRLKCSFVLHLSNHYNRSEMLQWIEHALQLEWHKQMTFTMAEVKGAELLGEIERIRPKGEVISIAPNIDMDGALEKLAEQAVNESNSDTPQEDLYRLALVRLINSVKKRDKALVLEQAKACLDIAVDQVKRDPAWIAQVVAVYTILYTDSLGSQSFDEAHAYADKAIESIEMGISLLEPSIGYRLLGNTYLGKASIYMAAQAWREASGLYRKGAEAYALCKDYLMQTEALRMCAMCYQHIGDEGTATGVYFEAFSLAEYLTSDLAKNSTFPMIAVALSNNAYRHKHISDDEFEQRLVGLLGRDWRDFLYQYKAKLQTPPQTI